MNDTELYLDRKSRLESLSLEDLGLLVKECFIEIYKRLTKERGFGYSIGIYGNILTEWPHIVMVDETFTSAHNEVYDDIKVYKI